MNAILKSHQIAYLATYLSVSHYNQIIINRNKKSKGYPGNTLVLAPEEIKEALNKCETKEQLYEYLEDFGDISDPMFGIVLDLLL